MSEEIENLLNQAIEFLNKDLETSQALSNMLVTFILQLLATLVLFLVIRFKFWNVITAMIEKRETKIADSLKEKDEALKELEIAKKEAEAVKLESKKTANLIIECGHSCKIIAKIESSMGIKNLPSILEECDGVMVARGDLGVEYPVQKLPNLQSYIISTARNMRKISIVAT